MEVKRSLRIATVALSNFHVYVESDGSEEKLPLCESFPVARGAWRSGKRIILRPLNPNHDVIGLIHGLIQLLDATITGTSNSE